MNLRQTIRKRVIGRARAVLSKVGKWPAYRAIVPVTAIADRLQGTLPGSLSDYEIDHVVALADFDLADPEEAARAFAVQNHQWMRRGDNQRKGRGGARGYGL